jgi:tight adherence protein B
MSSASALLAALALLFAACGLLLWRRAQARLARERAARHIERRVAQAGTAMGAAQGTGQGARDRSPAEGAAAAVAGASGLRGFDAGTARTGVANHAAAATHRWFSGVALTIQSAKSRAGIEDLRKGALLVGLIAVALALWAWRFGGAVAALAVLAAVACIVMFSISLRVQRRRMKLIAQLPSFLDGIVRLIVLGNSVPAAFQAALLTTEAPLRECLDHVSRMLRTGVEIDRALHQIAQIYRARELELVGAVLRLSVRYGGRADVMLERMATFMRDLEQAQRELIAMSAETRLSAWVLAILPLGIASFLFMTNPHYFSAMWNDASGRALIYLALALQATGAVLLYRFARLRSPL